MRQSLLPVEYGILLFVIFNLTFLNHLSAQQCPAGSTQDSFSWYNSATGQGAVWDPATFTDPCTTSHTVVYPSDGGLLNVNTTLSDPNNQNTDPCNPSTFFPNGVNSDYSGTYNASGYPQNWRDGRFMLQVTSTAPNQDVCFTYDLSSPAVVASFEVSDIDWQALWVAGDIPNNVTYQDQVSFSASYQGNNVPLTLTYASGSAATSSYTINGQTALANYDGVAGSNFPGTNGDVTPEQPAGTVSVSSGGAFIDSFTVCYSNGPADVNHPAGDPGLSDDHAITLDGFDIICVADLYTVSGNVFNDADGLTDSTVDGTGIGSPGGTQLYATLVDDSGNVYQSVPVNADGTYSFSDVIYGDYTVQISTTNESGNVGSAPSTGPSLPSGWINTGEEHNNPGGTGGDGTVDGSLGISITGNTTNVDFGIQELGSISGTVLADTTGDGAGDTPLSGVTMALYDNTGSPVLDGSGNPITTTTAADGTYSFDNVPAGDYQVVETDPTGYISVSDVDGANNNTVGDETPITVTPGADSGGNDFVDTNLGSISGTVLADTTGDGAGDTPLSGVTMALYDNTGSPVLDGSGNPITTTTAADGTYSFDNVPAGDYQVVETDPTGYISVSDVDGANNNTVGDETPITVTPGADSGGNDFVDTNLGSISGTVLADTTGDGAGDTPLSGVTMALYDNTGSPVLDGSGNPITTTTAADGTYSFDNVPAGDYQVVETDPTGYISVSDVDGANNNTVGDETPITVTPGADSGGNDFVDTNLGSISGTVLADTTGDGAGDTPLSGVTMALYDNTGSPVLDGSGNPITTTTAADGTYSFDNVPAGDYQVVETDPTGYISVSDVDGANNNTVGDETPITVTPGADSGGNDFVDTNLGSISGTVLADTTGDGAGDTPLSGVTMALYDNTGSPVLDGSGNPITTTTAADGTYSFDNVPAGDYQVVETDPTGYISVSDVDGANNNTVGDETPITVTPGADSGGNDFVDTNLGSISGTVLADTTGDGAGDTPLSGVTMALYDNTGSPVLDGSGNPITTTTAADGTYSFDNVPAGDYQVVETDPTGYISVSDVDGANNNTVGDETPITVTPGADSGGNDFVDTNLGSISGTVLADTTGDGAGDTPLSGVTMALYDNTGSPVLDGSGNPITTTTAADGTYSFDNVPAGDYQVVETDPTGYISVSDVDGANNNTVGDETPITVTPGADSGGNDFVDTNLGSISGTVLADTTGDGAGDTPLSGVTMALYDNTGSPVLDGSGNPITTTTAADGTYSFDNVPAGDYQVVETDPTGYISVSDVDGANNNTVGDETPITVTPGADSGGNDFVDTNLGSISGTVLADTTGDGAGDTPLSGVTMALYDNTGSPVLDGSGNPITTTTAADGTYSFDNVPAGDYQVVETDPTGYISVSDVDGANNNTVGDETPITVTPGADSGGNDFVDTNLGSISGTVLADTTGDGAGDTPLSGVTMALYDNTGSPVLDGSGNPITTTTAADGTYSFDNVPAGDYQVVETDPTGYISVSDVDGANNNTVGDETPITVTPGADSGGNDFVDTNLGSISGTVLADTTGDGAGDTPLSGVTMALYDNTGSPVLDGSGNPITTTTAADGTYSFDNVPAGDYQVVETDPTGYISVSDVDGANNNTVGDETPITVTPGADSGGNDFVDTNLGSISGTVLADTTGDGAGDTPLSGVTMALYDNTGSPVLDGSGNPITTTTAADGTYSFDNVPAGDYQVVETDPTGYISVSDVDGANNNTVGDETPITVTPGADSGGNDFVDTNLGSISGTVLADTTGDGAGDTPLSGVTMALYDNTGSPVLDGSGNPITTTTAADGTYSFDNVPAGDYQVVETDPTGYISVSDVDGANNNTVGDETPITVTPGADSGGNDFVDTNLGSISGTVLADTTGDGAGDTPLSGVTMALYDNTGSPVLDGSGNPITTTTAADGTYSFDNVPAGDYQVVETDPTGYISVSDVDGANNNTVGDETPITVTPGADSGGNDFVDTNLGSISGTVLADTTGDGAGDTPLSGVTMALYDNTGSPVLDGSGNPITTTTAADGTYSFDNVPAGDYQVVETDPTGYISVSDVDGANNNTVGDETPITVTPGADSGGNDFVDTNLGSISGTVLADTTGDGAGDTPLSGVTMALYDNTGSPVLDGSGNPITTTTAADGTYSFDNVPAGDYQVVETDPTGYISVSDVDGANNNTVGDETPITVTPGADSGGNDFVDTNLGSISGTVLADTTGDGAGDTPLSGVTMALYDNTGSPVLDGSGNPITTTTAADGTYSFDNVPAGDYQVVETDPTGYISVSDVDGANNNTVGDETPITVTPGADSGGNDFVDTNLGSISGTVLADTTGDGAGDTPLSGVTMALYDNTGSPVLDGSGNPITTTTAADGTYSFDNVPAGDYQVVETDPTGYISVSDVDGANNNTVGDETPITVTPGADSGGNDFVDTNLGSISGTVLADTTGDGAGDTPLSGVTMALYDNTGSPVLDGSGNPITTTTAADGTYSFDNVPAGDYQVVETDPTGYISVSDVDGANNNTVGDETPITVTPGADSGGNDFVDTNLGSISGTVLADTTGDGAGDTPLSGVTMALYDNTGSPVLDGSGNPITTTTAADGTYSFDNVPAGDYQVVETDPTGYISVSDVDGANNNTVGDETPITVTPGADSGGNDFVDTNLGSISGTVLADTTGDGAGDTPLSGVTMALYDNTGSPVLDGSGNPITTTTAADGTYSFDNVPAGDYQVVETDPTGYISVSDVDGANNNTVGDETPITVTPGADSGGNDFVDTNLGSISGTVLADTTGDGAGDTPLSGVTMALYDNTGSPVLDGSGNPITTTTAADGTYSFDNVPAGDYQVVETDPTGYISVSDVDGANNNTVGDETPITVTPGADSGGNDFVDQELGSISGSVWADTTGNGNVDTPLQNVELNLVDENGNPVLDVSNNPITATTDSNGNYTFTNVPAGNYQVVQTQPADYSSMGDTDGGDLNIVGDVQLIVVNPGAASADNNFTEFLTSLPVELVSFTAEVINDDVELNWVTATEENNDKFVVEYSVDGITFNTLTEISGNGTTNETSYYSYLHENAVNLGYEVLYYRLKQVDFDGTFEYSDIVAVEVTGSVKEAKLFPNPGVRSGKGVTVLAKDIQLIEVFSLEGRLMFHKEYAGENVTIMPTSNLATGMYLVRINRKETLKLIIR